MRQHASQTTLDLIAGNSANSLNLPSSYPNLLAILLTAPVWLGRWLTFLPH